MSRLWFTADTHFNHPNIIDYCDRPFKDSQDMDKKLMHNWNERVKPDDTIIVVGDFRFNGNDENSRWSEVYTLDYLKEHLNGTIILIRGNHDSNNQVKTKIKSLTIELGGYDMFMIHNPEDYNRYCNVNIVGHVHGLWKSKVVDNGVLVNVGVDVWNYRPVSMRELINVIDKTIKKGADEA